MQPYVLPFAAAQPRLAPTAVVMPNATLVGDVDIGEEASVWYGCILRGDVNRILIGARSNLQDGSIVHVSPGTWPALVGEDVLVGHGALLHGCTLQDRSYVGMRATLLNGVVVESGALVAAGALIVEGTRVRSGELWGGAPTRKLRDVDAAETQHMRDAVQSYVKLAREHREMHARATSGRP